MYILYQGIYRRIIVDRAYAEYIGEYMVYMYIQAFIGEYLVYIIYNIHNLCLKCRPTKLALYMKLSIHSDS